MYLIQLFHQSNYAPAGMHSEGSSDPVLIEKMADAIEGQGEYYANVIGPVDTSRGVESPKDSFQI